MNYQTLFQPIPNLMLVTLLLVGCGSPLATLKTSAGDLTITKVQFVDKFPPNCTPNTPSCSQAQSGYKILIVQMESKSGDDIGALYEAIPEEVYIVVDNDSQTESFASQYILPSATIFLAFAVKDSEHNFKLIWPDQPPIDLGQ